MFFWNTVNFVGFSVIHVSHGSVATYVRYGGMSIQRCIANFLLSLSVKEFLKSVNIWQSYCQSLGAWFFGTRCIVWVYLRSNFCGGLRKTHLFCNIIVDFGTNQKGVCDFLLAINSNFGPILHRFWDMATYWLNIANFSYPISFNALGRGKPFGISGSTFFSPRLEFLTFQLV